MTAKTPENRAADNRKDSARQIWLAGLGAFARTQEEGGKFFDALVREGQAADARAKRAPDGRAERTQGRIGALQGKAENIRDQATGTWNKLEEVFQARVARALRRLGVPGHDDIRQLFERVDALARNVQALAEGAEAGAKPKTIRTAKPAEPAATP